MRAIIKSGSRYFAVLQLRRVRFFPWALANGRAVDPWVTSYQGFLASAYYQSSQTKGSTARLWMRRKRRDTENRGLLTPLLCPAAHSPPAPPGELILDDFLGTPPPPSPLRLFILTFSWQRSIAYQVSCLVSPGSPSMV